MSLIERCPHFMGQDVHITNVWDGTSCLDLDKCFYFRVSLLQGRPYFITSVVFLFHYLSGILISLPQGCPYFRGVLISRVPLFHGCPYFITSGVPLFQGCSCFKGALISRMFLFQGDGCPYFRDSSISDVLERGSVVHTIDWYSSISDVLERGSVVHTID